MQKVKSSNLAAVGYADEVLSVQFKDGGPIYDYPGVTAEKHQALMNADSIGSHFHDNIRNRKFTKREA